MRRPEILWIPVLTLMLLACAGNSAPDSSTTEPSPGATTTEEEETPVVTDVPGHVVEVMEGKWALQPDDDEGTRYAPDDLPEEFQVDGLAVIFSGEVGEIPPNVRLYGTPLHLTDIRRREE